MWYIFPLLRGLGISSMAHKYGIINLDEAKAYLEHPVLSGRLYELCGELLKHKDKTALEIFGDIDEMKLKVFQRSCSNLLDTNIEFKRIVVEMYR